MRLKTFSRNTKVPVILFQSFLFILLSSFIYASPLSQNGQLRVSGNQLVNECGTAIQLRGVSSHGLQWYGFSQCMDYCCVSDSALTHLANNVGIDVFRIAVYPEPNGYISNPSGFTAQTNSIVQLCEDKGIYALIDWHTLTPGDPNSSITYARQFWESMATAHKDRKNVLYEICNEPNGVSWSQVKTYANDIIPRIRAIDPDAVIIVGTPNWSQLGEEVVSSPLSYSNIMYTFHFYAATHDTPMLTNFVGRLPIFVTEWAATEASGAGGTNTTRADSFISIMQTNKISWCAWSWSEAPETSGMLNAGTCDTANWTSLKPMGSYVVGKVSNPADNFGSCVIPTATRTATLAAPLPTDTVVAADLRLDNMTDGDYTSNICTYWYTYDDSNDCTDKNCTANPHGNSQVVPWSKDHWQDLGLTVQPFYMQAPGRNGPGDYAARITGVVTTTFLYGFVGLGLPLTEPEGPVNISTATGIRFWCKSNASRSFRLKINSPGAFGGALDADMYGYVFTAGTSWSQVTVDFASVLFSQEGWGTTATKTQALSYVDTIQWQTQGQTGAPYSFELWIDDVVLMNAPTALKNKAAAGCGGTATPTNTPTRTYTNTFTRTATNTATRTATNTVANTATGTATYTATRTATNTVANTATGTATFTATRTATYTSTATATGTATGTATRTATTAATFTNTATSTSTNTAINTFTATGTPTRTSTTTNTALPTNTNTPVNTQTNTQTDTQTMTRTATRTGTASFTPSFTATHTYTNTPSNTRTATGTYTITGTFTQTQTASQTRTGTQPATNTPTHTYTHSNTATFTNTAVNTWTATQTPVNTNTRTATPVNTGTNTNTPQDTSTATGTPTRTMTPANTPTETVTSGAYLTAQITVTPDIVNTGDTITVIMVVSNSGNIAADNVMPSALTTAGAGGVSLLTSPPSAVSIPAGGSAGFTWTYNADSAGVVTFQGSASGVDAVGAWTVTAGAASSNALAIGVPLPTHTQTFTVTRTSTATETAVNTATHTWTSTYTWTATNTAVNTLTFTATATHTSSNTATDTPTASYTNTPQDTYTQTPTGTYTAVNTPTETPTPVFTNTPTQTPPPADQENFEIKNEIAFPNPYKPGTGMPLRIRADFSRKHGDVQLRVYTPSLRCIKVFNFAGSFWAGPRTIDIPASSLTGLASGSYYYVITAVDEKGAKARSGIPSLIILK